MRLPAFIYSASVAIPRAHYYKAARASVFTRPFCRPALHPLHIRSRPSPLFYHQRHRPLSTMQHTDSTHANGNHTPNEKAYKGEILCNRALNMSKIKAIGFDMDYTLAMYHSEQFEMLAATSALHKLVHSLGYPKALLHLKYDHSFFIRGLVVDKVKGNIIKVDRHKYVKRAMHGTTVMSKEARAEMYDQITKSGGGFVEPRFAVLDAMFALPDAFLFSSVVDYKDKHPDEIQKDYMHIYKDVRRSVDMCHRDGSIKDRVGDDPERYIQFDEALIPTLRRLKRSGRKVFLLTNSLWNYTDVVMNFLYSKEPSGHWTDLFDLVITASCKPAFMLDARLPLYRCDPETGYLTNTEGVYEQTAEEYLRGGKCFQGGNFMHLHDMLEVTSGTQVLYVGDHIFSDVLRSKRTLGWRTMLVIPELEDEINMLYDKDTVALGDDIQLLRDARDELDEWVDRLEGELVLDDLSEARREVVQHELEMGREAMERARGEIIEKMESYHRRFHPIWGQLLKTGQQNSRFAEQVESYACLYTSQVSNIGLVSPEIYWRAMSDLMPHDRLSLVPMHRVLNKRAMAEVEVEERR